MLLFIIDTGTVVLIPINAIEVCDVPTYILPMDATVAGARAGALRGWFDVELKPGGRLLRKQQPKEVFRPVHFLSMKA